LIFNMHFKRYLFPSRIHSSPHLSTRQYARIVDDDALEISEQTEI
jgi:hypothetical protein